MMDDEGIDLICAAMPSLPHTIVIGPDGRDAKRLCAIHAEIKPKLTDIFFHTGNRRGHVRVQYEGEHPAYSHGICVLASHKSHHSKTNVLNEIRTDSHLGTHIETLAFQAKINVFTIDHRNEHNVHPALFFSWRRIKFNHLWTDLEGEFASVARLLKRAT